MSGYLTTFSGKFLSVQSPKLEQICIEDIAHGLSNLCHWGGQVKQFFSIAQHCLIVCDLCPPELKKWGLMHDAAEAYVGDMARPVKVLLPSYKKIELRILRVIAAKFDFGWPEPKELKQYDNLALAAVAKKLMPEGALHDGYGNMLNLGEIPEVDAFPMEPRVAKEAFLSRFHSLYA